MNLNINSHVSILSDEVRKVIPNSSSIVLSAEKYRKSKQIGDKHGFLVPQILSVSDNTLVFEKMDFDQSLKEKVRLSVTEKTEREYTCKLIEQCGSALYRLHSLLELSSQTLVTIPDSILKPTGSILNSVASFSPNDDVMLHCDYSLNNIFVMKGNLVIIDPLPNNHSSHHVDEKGSRYMDIALFLHSINQQLGIKSFARHDRKQARTLRRAFLDGYEKEAAIILDRKFAHALSYGISCNIAGQNVNSLFHRTVQRLIIKFVVKNEIQHSDVV